MPWKELIRYPNWKNVWQKVQSTRKKGVVKGGWDSEPSRGEEKLGKAPLMKPKMLVMVYDTRLLCAVLETKLDSEKHLFFFFSLCLCHNVEGKTAGGRGWWQGPNPKPHSNRKHKRYKNPNRDRTQNQPVRDVSSGHQPNNKGPA